MEAVYLKKIRYLYLALVFGFILGISDGYVALWKDGDPKPAEVFPYQARFLPVSDQQALERGIHLNSIDELNQLLEDYLS